MANISTVEAIEELAAEIGENVYIDIAKWHLYLNDAHLHQVLAEQLYPLLTDNSLEEDRVVQILQRIPVKIGGGRREISLAELLPMQSQMNLIDILEAFQRKM